MELISQYCLIHDKQYVILGKNGNFLYMRENYRDPTLFGNRTGSGIKIFNSRKSQGKSKNTILFYLCYYPW